MRKFFKRLKSLGRKAKVEAEKSALWNRNYNEYMKAMKKELKQSKDRDNQS